MQVKVFEAPDMATGLKMIKKSLGPDALILSTKTIRKGKVGLLAKPIMEITAAVDTPDPAPPTSKTISKTTGDTLTYDSLWKTGPEPKPQTQRVETRPYDSRRKEDPQKLKGEIKELRDLVNGLTKKMSDIDNAALTRAYVEPEYTSLKYGAKPRHHPVIQILMSRGVSMEAAAQIAHSLDQKLDSRGPAEGKYSQDSLIQHIRELFHIHQVLPQTLGETQKRIALIGPTGVGKTTTIAKLAAGYMNRYHGKIGLITIDTYRIAAVEQLKVYGEIMQLPVEVVIKPEGLSKALEKLSDRDLILIDTAGRSPRNENELQEMTTFLRPHLQIENHLVLSATTREQELMRTIERFSCLPLTSFLYTKLDECGELGVLLNMRLKNDTPLSFLTNGQRVPEDIMKAYPETVADLIMNTNAPDNGRNLGA